VATTDKLFAGSIPEIYDRFLVPLIFEPYARDLAARLAELKPRDVLEIAAGSVAVVSFSMCGTGSPSTSSPTS
jgi:hypothetical protein